ncbi:MAG: chitobiase/beta-hexosaminidase C-terminal domain-containing protein, partial [Proteobacteria bacterium]|nr:chitobiase/beta-hexosaminidase C-terminal domain-containing protein [Pseudomonadota bacterium]
LLGACGDDNPGTPIDAGVDAPVAITPSTVASPRGGTVRSLASVTLTATPAATIYYTTDGSEPTTASTSGASPLVVSTLTTGGTLKFFAAGSPSETVQTETYVIDRLGPIAVDGFTATVNGADVDLAWTNPASFADVIVARTSDVAATVPTDGATLAVGATVGAGTVVYVGNAMAFKDVAPGVGGNAYVAWARYASGTYAEGRTASAYVEPAAQTGQIVINTTAGTATVTTQPTAWTLATSNYAVDVGNATLISFDVTATSNLKGVTFMPKLVKTGLVVTGAATATLTPDGTLGAADVVLLGGAVAGNGALTRRIAMTVSAPDTVTFDFTVRNGANGYGAYRELVVSADGRWLYAGQRAAAHVVKIDTTTGAIVAGLDLGTAATRGSMQIALDPSGRRLYATFNDGMHIGGSRTDVTGFRAPAPTANTAYLLEIDASTMTETGRLPITTATDPLHIARRPTLSRDGRQAAFAIGGPYTTADTSEIAVVDLSAFALRDADAATAGQQNLATGAQRPTSCAFSWTADRLLCMASTNGRLGDNLMNVKLDDLTMTIADGDGVPTTNNVTYKVALPRADGSFWLLGDNTGLETFAPATGTFTVLSTDSVNATTSAEVSADGASVLAISYRDVNRYSTTDGVRTVVGVQANQSAICHTTALSPF